MVASLTEPPIVFARVEFKAHALLMTTNEINALIAAVATNVESPVPSQPRLSAFAYKNNDMLGVPVADKTRIRIAHSRHNKEATAQINAYKVALVTALRAAGFEVYKVRGAGLRFMYCPSMGNPKDGLAWDLEVRKAAA